MKFAIASFLLVCITAVSPVAAQDTTYLFTDLGHADDLSSEANAISAGGVVVGSIEFNSAGTPRQRAFWYSDGVRHFDFESGSPNMRSEAVGVNAAGCAVGWTQATDGAWVYLARWKAADTCPFNDGVNLTHLGGANTGGQAINSANLMVGYSLTDTGDFHGFSMTLNTTAMTDLGVLPGGWNSAAWDVNEGGLVVGYSTSSTVVQTATLWEGEVPTDLGAFPGSAAGTESYAFAINDLPSPQIVGWSYGPQAVGHPHAFIWQNGTMADLGTLLGGDWSEAFDVNDHGDVVGWARGADFYVYAVLWVGGQILDLNTVDGVPPGWVLAEARGINNAGQIVGRGVFGGSDRAFMLTPILFAAGFEDGTFGGWTSVVGSSY